MQNEYSIRPYKTGDAQGIIALYARTFGREVEYSRWKWLYLNQVYPSVIVVAEQHGKIVGHVSGLLKPMVYFGRSSTALHSFYAMVDSKYRRSGMFMDMMQVLEKQTLQSGADIIYGFSYQEQVFPALQRLGRQEIGLLPVYIMPLHPIRLGTLKVPAAKYMESLDSAAARVFGNGASPLPTMPAIAFDQAYEDLWLRVMHQRAIAVPRNTTFLSWRYSARPGGGYRVMAVQGPAGLEGYAILRTKMKWGLTIVFVMELVVPHQDSDAFDRLVSGITYFALSMGADAVSLVAGPACTWADSLMAKGFLKAPAMLLPRKIRLTMKPLIPGVQLHEMMDPGVWMVSWGDTLYI